MARGKGRGMPRLRETNRRQARRRAERQNRDREREERKRERNTVQLAISTPAPYGPETPQSFTISRTYLLPCWGLFHELLHRILSWSRLLYQHVSLSSSGTPQCPDIHHHVIPSLVLEPKLLSLLHPYLLIPKAPLPRLLGPRSSGCNHVPPAWVTHRA